MTEDTTWSRRRMLVLAASAAGAATLAGPLGQVASAATTGGTGARAATGLRRDHWTGLLGKKVTLDGPAGRVKAVVAAVEDLRGAPVGAPGQFSVDLHVQRGPALTGLVPVTIPGRGVSTLGITAVERGAVHRTSQIIVNNPS